ncbi:MAG: hypothetical protein CVU11_10460 [Bacteroidetes bacterium HGW-Bacteroidetes-6]|jgi:hypothetical protein|nr:MAG: hypothetical protein CVU11_10460 [Bacteroidetes bacterium HGW-Bacteroidetes-6]
MIKNKYKRITIRAGLILGLISLTLFFMPSMAGIDGMNGGFALQVFGFFIFITTIIVVVIYGRMANMYARLAKFESILAHWQIGTAEYARFIKYDIEKNIVGYRLMRKIISIITLVVGLILIIAGLEAIIVAYIIGGIILLIWFVSFLAIINQKSKSGNSGADIILSKEGGIINGELHNWSKMGNVLEGGGIGELEGKQYVLEIAYSAPNRGARVDVTARFPVPEGKLTEAEFILDKIMDRA